jgi:hypothetical protein
MLAGTSGMLGVELWSVSFVSVYCTSLLLLVLDPAPGSFHDNVIFRFVFPHLVCLTKLKCCLRCVRGDYNRYLRLTNL